ncbi:MAG: class A beta-lactamase [Deltaproteobacteria bacterium]|nr:class A beta-lactamase [Deltaproteobacteria bacterium]
MNMNLLLSIVSLVLLLSLSAAGFAQTPAKSVEAPVADIPRQRLEREIARAAQSAGGLAGVSAIHIESGRRIALNPHERFPMASTYKVPIAVQLLSRVDQGEINLDQMVELKPSDFRPGSGILTSLLNKPGVILSVRNLLELMLLVSDNSATDLLLRLAGGPEAVTARMRALGIRDMEINRPTINLIADSAGYTLPPEKEWAPELFKKLYEATTPDSRQTAATKFETDPRDTSTPEAMVMLLERICRGDLLKRESGALLLDIMERCRTGPARLKGILPSETIVAHKTGTIGGTLNDVGIIKLPEDTGHVAIAVFVRSSGKEIQERERAIAQIARAVYDFFLFQPSTPPAVKQ